MKRLLTICGFWAALLLAPSLSWAACEVQTGTASYSNGMVLGADVCDNTGAKKTNPALIAGERLQDSATKSYIAMRDEADVTIVGVTTAVTLCGGVANDCHLLGLQITTALTGTCVVTGFADSAGAATSLTFPIGSVGLKDFKGAKNSAGALTITCATGGDDNFVAVLTRPAI